MPKKNFIHLARIAAFLVSLLAPFTAFSAAILTIDDSIAGLGTEVTVKSVETAERLSLLLENPLGEEFTMPMTTANGATTLLVPGRYTEVAGKYSGTLRSSRHTLAETSFEISPGKLDVEQSELSLERAFLEADGEDTAKVTVILRDAFGNPLPGRPTELITSRSTDRITPLASETDSEGRQRFLLRTREPGPLTVTALDILSSTVLSQRAEVLAGAIPPIGGHPASRPRWFSPEDYSLWEDDLRNAYPTFTPYSRRTRASLLERTYAQGQDFDILGGFEITVDPPELHVNDVASVRIRAVDRFGQTVQDYIGTVRIYSPTDPEASLPGFGRGEGEVTFAPRNLGEKLLPLVLSFTRPGPQTLRIEDRTDPRNIISGEIEILVSGEAGIPDERRIQITSHKQDQAVNTNEITLEGIGPPFVNLLITGGTEDVQGETDQTGRFSAPVKLSPTQRDFTLRVRDDSGRYDSGSLHLILDQEDPEIRSMTFSPEKPQKGSNVLLIVESEPQLARLTMRLSDEDDEKPLTENSTEAGTYQLLFTAPASGSYQPILVAVDAAGNTTEVRTMLLVTPDALPKVQNVKAEARANAVELTWDPITEEKVDAYRVYVGEKPGDFLYTLDTDRATSSATVAGLRAGELYYFAATALAADRESAEKSDVVSARVLGTKMTVTEQEESLLLEWTFPEGTPLSSFLLEYGIEAARYTEKRILNGELRAYTLRDLLGGVTYYLRLTPISTTGDLLSDLTATGQGKPIASGFHAAAPEAIPISIVEPPAVPRTPASGIPPIAVWSAGGLSALLLLLHWHRRRTLREAAAFLQMMEARYRNPSL